MIINFFNIKSRVIVLTVIVTVSYWLILKWAVLLLL